VLIADPCEDAAMWDRMRNTKPAHKLSDSWQDYNSSVNAWWNIWEVILSFVFCVFTSCILSRPINSKVYKPWDLDAVSIWNFSKERFIWMHSVVKFLALHALGSLLKKIPWSEGWKLPLCHLIL
jgi:hypothetical protein